MTLYEIDKQIYDLLDPETGEIADYEAFEALQMARETKIENTALFIKNLTAEAEAIKAEKKRLAQRQQDNERTIDRLTAYLDRALNGENFKTARCVCTYRRTQAADPDAEFVEWAMVNAPDLLRFKTPEADKDAIKKAIKEGRQVEHATMKDGISFSIK